MDARRGCQILRRTHSTIPFLTSRSQTLASQRSFHFSPPCAQQAAARAPTPEEHSNSTAAGGPQQQQPDNSALTNLVNGLKRTRSDIRQSRSEASQNYLRDLGANRNRTRTQTQTQNSSNLPFSNMSDMVNIFDPSRIKGFVPRGGNLNNLVPDAGTTTPDIGPAPEPPPMKVGPPLGRSIRLDLDAGVGLETGMRKLDMLISSNRIRSESNRQKFHERAGLKRKRLKSERWRRRFRVGFNHMCERVTTLKRQGW